MKSKVLLKCIKGSNEKLVELEITSTDEVDETSNIIEHIQALRDKEHFDVIKYLRLERITR